jgi:hypothetical protein
MKVVIPYDNGDTTRVLTNLGLKEKWRSPVRRSGVQFPRAYTSRMFARLNPDQKQWVKKKTKLMRKAQKSVWRTARRRGVKVPPPKPFSPAPFVQHAYLRQRGLIPPDTAVKPGPVPTPTVWAAVAKTQDPIKPTVPDITVLPPVRRRRRRLRAFPGPVPQYRGPFMGWRRKPTALPRIIHPVGSDETRATFGELELEGFFSSIKKAVRKVYKPIKKGVRWAASYKGRKILGIAGAAVGAGFLAPALAGKVGLAAAKKRLAGGIMPQPGDPGFQGPLMRAQPSVAGKVFSTIGQAAKIYYRAKNVPTIPAGVDPETGQMLYQLDPGYGGEQFRTTDLYQPAGDSPNVPYGWGGPNEVARRRPSKAGFFGDLPVWVLPVAGVALASLFFISMSRPRGRYQYRAD